MTYKKLINEVRNNIPESVGELDEMMVGMMISAKDATKEVFNTWAKSDMAPDKLDKIIADVAKKNKVDEKKLHQVVYTVMDKAVNS